MARKATSQSHQSDPRVLGRRTLEQDHRQLVSLLVPGMHVLDIGCGTGAITVGIARTVGAGGRVVGVDRDASLLEIARQHHPGVTFVEADVLALPADWTGQFDVVNAARTLQWVRDPQAAVAAMARVAKRGGGLVVALDYDHALNTWSPDPPELFRDFYREFLRWREANGWDNKMASHLPALFEHAGLSSIAVADSKEVARRGEDAARLWLHVVESIGPRMTAEGFTVDVQAVAESYGSWLDEHLEQQTLCMLTVVARRSGSLR